MRHRRWGAVAVTAAATLTSSVLGFVGRGPAGAHAAEKRPNPSCTPRLLVLAAFPAEVGPLLDAATGGTVREVDERRFHLGRLGGRDVAIAMTGIGMVNATRTTEAAFRAVPCLTGVVFSGVAGGGPGNAIGDVAVPARWTADGGRTWLPSDPRMLAVARRVEAARLPLASRTPLGDPACACVEQASTVGTVDLGRAPVVRVGGDGSSGDTFQGRAFPCIPFGGDVFGCEPCRDVARSGAHAAASLMGAGVFLDPEFILANLVPPPAASDRFRAVDMESAAAHAVARRHRVPFIAFRAISDGAGDPVGLPGFPFQFFFYRQLAADNAAAAAVAFVRAYRDV